MTVNDLIEELHGLDPNSGVPIDLAVAATGWDASYRHAALERLEQLADQFGRHLGPEVEAVMVDLAEVL